MLPPHLIRWIPFLFVLLWSTGFIGAKYALPYAEPFTVLAIRMYITLGVFLALIKIYRPRWPNPTETAHSMVVGALVHGAYLGGVFAAINAGMSAGLSSLLVGLQPILTALIAWGWMGDRISKKQLAGLLLGIAGVSIVLLLGKSTNNALHVTTVSLLFALMALFGITLGTLYQKRFCGKIDLLPGTFYQYLANAIIMSCLSLLFETGEVQWEPQFIIALLWLVFGLSLSAILLLMLMIREGEATKVAAYFYLTPPVTALLAWILFDEQLTPWGAAGVCLTAYGVYLVIRNTSPRIKNVTEE
ncbi:DMT family transporter [Sedimenticola selenatireducens]|uniref:DMT family transporter n=1 Tax=Sedimenticola selenatireducens TaxID=191960 RepID=A0A557RZ77_9GAMM|nr:DMT family transporter [Sedimenticola selenatireducens]TVO70462.1 DMT family transporter [Sedimenticola selenatireducens]TVT63039.1 MAG: DMT family transporter [Sedimenticola selenatireducens]